MKQSMLVGIRRLLPGVLIVVGPSPGALAADLNVPFEYPTIQAAVDAAASGDTIRIEPGDYYEQVVITNKSNLTLAGEPGEPGSVLHAFAGMVPKGVSVGFTNIVALNAINILLTARSQVVFTNLTFDGAGLGDLYPDWLWGVTFSGSNARVENCTIKGFRGATGTQARGIQFSNRLGLGTPIVNVSVLNCIFVDNMWSLGIGADDQSPDVLRVTFTVEGNTFVGFGPTSTRFHRGLWIFTGAGGEVKGNTMTGFSYGGATPGYCAAITHFDGQYPSRGFSPVQAVRYEGNTFSNNADHLMLLTANESQVVNNIFHGTGPGTPRWGGLSVSGTNIVVANNDFSGMPNGIVLFGNDAFGSGWPIPPVSNVSLNANWFCDVATPVSVREGATGIEEQGSQMCPFRPLLQSITSDGLSVDLGLRSWHGQPVVFETSIDLQSWSPIHTNVTALPRIGYSHGNGMADGRRFYRAVQE